jgi:tight adherence protein B
MTLLAAALTGIATALVVRLLQGRPVRPGTRAAARWRAAVHARATWLVQAGAPIRPGAFYALSAAAGGLVLAAVLLLTATPAVALVPALTATLLPAAWLGHQRAERLREVQRAWPDGLREISTGVAAGMSLPQAIAALADAGPDALRAPFARYTVLARMAGPAAALEFVRDELADPTSDRILEVLVLALDRGGTIVTDLLRDLAEAATADLQAAEQIATDGLEQRLNARAVFVLPWLALLALTIRPGHFRTFYAGPGGLLVIIVAALASLGGMWLVSRLAAEPVEERILVQGEGPP